jgi:hypothetical protein
VLCAGRLCVLSNDVLSEKNQFLSTQQLQYIMTGSANKSTPEATLCHMCPDSVQKLVAVLRSLLLVVQQRLYLDFGVLFKKCNRGDIARII